MIGIALGLMLVIGGLALITYLKAREATGLFRRLVDFMDRSTKRVGGFALVPGLVVTGWILHRGVAPVAAIIIGIVASSGLFAVSLAILRMEGMLTETESAAAFRLARGEPPPSTTVGRVVWALVGLALLAASLLAVHVVS